MHISKLSLVNYRNFSNTKLLFNKGINTIIGENGSGKTNLFRAIRLLLDDNMIRSAYKLDEKDFHRGLGKWQGHWIIISLVFEEISEDEAVQALFLHGAGNLAGEVIGKATYNLIFRPKYEIRFRLSQLPDGDHAGLDAILKSVTIDDYETLFTGKSEADFNDQNFYNDVVGDFENVKFNKELEFPTIGSRIPVILSISKEISFTFIQALRDVVADFHNNRTNPLLTLLKSKSGEIKPELFKPITEMVKNLNNSIEQLPDVQAIRTDITDTIKDAAGETYSPSSLSIKSDLSDEADKLFQSLKLFVGESEESYEGTIHELSLGGANLIYLTLKLLEFKYQKSKQSFANFLLIEEPEAHIHTHIQKTLFDKLSFTDTQIIYSTHSTHISEVSHVQNINILGMNAGKCEAYQPSTGLAEPDIGNIQRYLDAVRSNLLFAKSVILVEGDAEEILIPILVKKVLGVSLDELGISLVNIRSTGFKNVAILFHNTRIRKKCSIITDLDTSIIDTTPDSADSEPLKKIKAKCKGSEATGVARKTMLDEFVKDNPWIRVFYAEYTFEVDFIHEGNVEEIVGILGDVYKDPNTIAEAKLELESKNLVQYGRRVLTMANNEGKGWFAILLGKKVDYKTYIPLYILNAIFFAHSDISKELWFNILSYRLRCIEKTSLFTAEVISKFKTQLDEFRSGSIVFSEIKKEMLETFPEDDINHILKGF
ncbi:MAG TPA: ATP-dependent endonuclease [Geobacter sp.]|nr:MAG: ATP-dependent endonuclease [Geobacteraceae bacterium GWF2_54_21]HCE67891.1 ATP-dependent endonuclease [Geobacter sp.]